MPLSAIKSVKGSSRRLATHASKRRAGSHGRSLICVVIPSCCKTYTAHKM
jgi:hypothetical protein